MSGHGEVQLLWHRCTPGVFLCSIEHVVIEHMLRCAPGGRRHNVGFMVIDKLASMEGIDCRKLEKSAAVGRGTIEGQEVSAGTSATT